MIRSVVFSAIALVTISVAHAQAYSSSSASLDYSFVIDPNSLGSANDLSIDDQGLIYYNLIVPFDPSNPSPPGPHYTPYTLVSGNGSASAVSNPGSYYDGSSWSGFSSVDSYAESDFTGIAKASAGVQETLVIYNQGTDDITFNLSASAYAFGTATASGAGASSSVDTYVGIFDVDLSTGVGNNPLIHIAGPNGGVINGFTNDWTDLGGGKYSAFYTFTIKAGSGRVLQLYTSSINRTQAVPEPASIAALGVGALGLLRRRRR